MVDVDTFLTTLYVMVDDFCQARSPKKRPGPKASLSQSEVITLAIFARWSRFASERDFYRYATDQLRDAFPTLPDRSQFNRLVRFYTDDIERMALNLAARMIGAGGLPTRPWTPRRCPLGMPSAGGTDGSPDGPTSAGPTA